MLARMKQLNTVLANTFKLILIKMCKFDNNIEIKFVNNWPEDEIVDLYKTGGWWKDSYGPSSIGRLIKGSYAFAVVVEKKSGKTIWMGQIISDGVSDAYI